MGDVWLDMPTFPRSPVVCNHVIYFLSPSLSLPFSLAGIPRHIESQEEYSRREPKQLKRESSPSPRVPDAIKGRPHDGVVPTVKEGGRSIHLIPPEGVLMTKAPKEGSITQVPRLTVIYIRMYSS